MPAVFFWGEKMKHKDKPNRSVLVKTPCESANKVYDFLDRAVAVYRPVGNGKDFVFTYFNSIAEKIEQINAKDVLGRKVTTVFPGVKKFGLFKVFQRVYKTGKPEHFPVKVYKDSRMMGWRKNFVNKLPTGEIIAIYDDCSERKKAEEMLRESEKKFKSFFENSNDAIFVADARTRKLVDCNNKAETLMECPKTKILSMRADKLHPKDKIKETMEGFKKQIEGKIDVVETEVLTKSGKRIPVAINASSIEFNGKNYLLGIFRDITEKKKAYEDIRQKKDELEHFAKFAVDRELKMIELKKEIEKLKREAK